MIGYNDKTKTLYVGEVTTSGYEGQRGRDFHIGAVKKVYEAFSKFYLLHDDSQMLLTVDEIQAIFKCGKDRALNIMKKAGFPTLQVFGTYYVKTSDFNKWLDSMIGKTLKF